MGDKCQSIFLVLDAFIDKGLVMPCNLHMNLSCLVWIKVMSLMARNLVKRK